jgi:hypothetical protein
LLAVADTAACVGAWLPQLGLGLAWAAAVLFSPVPPAGGSLLALADAAAVVVGLPLALTLGVTFGLGLEVVLAEALALELLGLPLDDALPLEDDVVGAVVVAVVALGELVLVSATAGCVEVEAQGLGEPLAATTGFVGPVPSAAEGTGVVL